MEDYTQLGIAGLTLAILFFTVRYFVDNSKRKDETIMELTNKFIDMTRSGIESQNGLKRSIDANTEVTSRVASLIKNKNKN